MAIGPYNIQADSQRGTKQSFPFGILPKNRCTLTRTLGKLEYEKIAEILVDEAQRNGKWVPVDSETIRRRTWGWDKHLTEMVAKGFLEEADLILSMDERGRVVEENPTYLLTEEALNRINRRYPSLFLLSSNP